VAVRDSARTREAILRAAEELFARQGFDATSMQQIAEKKRHPTLKSIAGSLVFYGIDPVIIEATLLAINQEQCQNKYDLKHIQDLIAYTIEKEQQKWAK